MTKVRVGLIGCGKVGQFHAVALRSLPEAELVAVCDASAERVQACAARYGAGGYTDLSAMLRAARLEAVLICTPPPLHAAPDPAALPPGAKKCPASANPVSPITKPTALRDRVLVVGQTKKASAISKTVRGLPRFACDRRLQYGHETARRHPGTFR